MNCRDKCKNASDCNLQNAEQFLFWGLYSEINDKGLERKNQKKYSLLYKALSELQQTDFSKDCWFFKRVKNK